MSSALHRPKPKSRPESSLQSNGSSNWEFLPEESFVSMFQLEQRRTERSRRPFVLMLLESTRFFGEGNKEGTRQKILSTLSDSTRETDIRGWYKTGSALGIIFTEIGEVDQKSDANALTTRIRSLLSRLLSAEQINQINLSFYVFPEDWNEGGTGRCDSSTSRRDFTQVGKPKKPSHMVKRSIDIVGSLFALIVASPLFMAIAVAIKLTSEGSVLFRQRRIGQYGHGFTFLKFRSMCSGNNSAIHEEFVKRLIAGAVNSEQTTDHEQNVYKLTDDPRVTAVGRFLRKTSLDELPQFLNVLMGEMSLVGPRPPVPYEVECYDLWHRRRLREVKPGITGLWQVTGRSKTKFDDMVRLDLQYARSWSLWLDLKILWRTPGAVLMGDGAY
jgi:lipopolysaccharide/colanic/teichoic acid biosynthesis glycosyltransferase